MAEVQSHPIFLTPQQLQPDLPLFVFLPGMDGTGQLLRSQTTGLGAAFDVRCLTIPLDDLNSWEVLAERVVSLVEVELSKKSDRPVYLCGESFGACLALKVALHAPQLFDRLILVNPASSFNLRPWIGWGAQLARWIPTFAFHLSSLALLPLLGNTSRMLEGDRQAFQQAVQSVPQSTTIWRLSLLQEFKISEAELRQLTQPTLLIASAADQLLPSVEEVQRLQRWLLDARAIILPRSGHACLLETDVNLYQIMQDCHFLIPQVAKVGML